MNINTRGNGDGAPVIIYYSLIRGSVFIIDRVIKKKEHRKNIIDK